MPSEPAWRIAVDTGGTFTDCLALDPDGALHRVKLLSSGALRCSVADRPAPSELLLEAPSGFPPEFFRDWSLRSTLGDDCRVVRSTGGHLELAKPWPPGEGESSEVTLQSPEDAAVVAVRWVTGTSPGRDLPALELRLATTRGTNALLERKGSEVAFFVTRGFGDLLEIGTQQRPDLFALDIRKPEPLWATVVEVDERLDADGEEVASLDEAALEVSACDLAAAGYRSAAVAFLHAYRDPRHELRAADCLKRAGFERVSLSSRLSRRIKIVPRAQTAVVDAYLADTLERYLEGVSSRLQPRSLHVMTSAGGLSSVAEYRPKDSLLSGPAAGVVGAAAAARSSQIQRIIAFDMGGTSTDVSRVDEQLELRSETTVGEARLLSPSVAVETVAAGGGSICGVRADRVHVGPQSAGAAPGPACYGAGGPLTLTDVNLLLGRLVPSRFPFEVDLEAALGRAEEVETAAGRPDPPRPNAAEEASAAAGGSGATGRLTTRDAFLAGFLAIANERMAGAIRAISVRRGYDPRHYSLVAFGGAGGQHAVALARLLGMRRVLLPADGALLSAAGLGAAPVERWTERQVLAPLSETERALQEVFAELAAEATEALVEQGVERSVLESGPRTVFLRFAGQEATLPVAWVESGSASTLVAAFRIAYKNLYGYLPRDREIEVESVRLAVRSTSNGFPSGPVPASPRSRRPVATQSLWDAGRRVDAPIFERSRLTAGESFDGPGLVVEPHTVTVVETGWSCRLDEAGALVLEDRKGASS